MRPIATGLLLILAGTLASAADVDEMLGEAVAAVRAGEHAKAADLYGGALAVAHRQGDLLAEERVVRAMEEDELAATTEVYLRLLAALDEKRSGAHLSAHLLATEILLCATREGDLEHVKQAAGVLGRFSRRAKVGKCAKAMRDYAAGMASLADRKLDAGATSLEKALALMVDEGWADLAVHAGTELAAVSLTMEQVDRATAALSAVAKTLPEDADRAVAIQWRTLVQKRLPDAPDPVLKVYNTAMAPLLGPHTASAAGGRGGQGAPGGSIPQSKVGRAWDRLGRKTPIATAKRTRAGFEIRHGFDRGLEVLQPFQHGVKYHDDGGVTLAFRGNGVALWMVDLKGLRGQPGEGSHPRPFQFFHRLARGEVWGVTRSGVVTISPR